MEYQKIDNEVQELLTRLSRRLSAEDVERIELAYSLAREAHMEQKRKSGEPYIMHPVAVAKIVAEELRLGANPIIAAFLHDVVEDTPYTIEDIRERFGDDVAFLVDVVTKKKKKPALSPAGSSSQIDNYKQMLNSLHYDIRALLIKLSDRLHNMRTLSSMRPDKQMKIAGETDYFYAPLAHRLGLYYIKREMENLSFRYRCPRDYAYIDECLAKELKEREAGLKSFMFEIERLLENNDIFMARTEVYSRGPYSAWRKMHSTGCDFKHVEGKYYIRIIYPNTHEYSEKDMSLKIYSILTDRFKEKPGSVANFIDSPKENGYQSYHVQLLTQQGTWEEVHISSERMIRKSQFGCIAESTETNITNWLEKFKHVLQEMATRGKEVEYMDGVTSSFYNDDITAYTPDGKAVILPKGATALDFAFEIHSELGLHAQYARINGLLVSVKTELERGDVVYIGKNDNIIPKKDWLEHVSTYKAKSHISTFLNRQRQLQFVRCEVCHPLPGDEVIGFKNSDGSISIHRRDCKSAIRLASQRGDDIVAVNFESDSDFLYNVRIDIRAVDRYHLLVDLIDCITNRLQLSLTHILTKSKDEIVDCSMGFQVHSAAELQEAISNISEIDGVDEVKQRIEY
ncbi:MAG: bifunctional (p)ppGpp synthetase/guanosine-3',5'-bis(diphosphate) 3'-pyrophosphohydrolase [Bacteroidaceae bacterium]|nr:bifunctional (p)ppGpp synthetase/guanosine-3',5'-bis(diphosphate) 3'-pyrophosphohydrolase [Bacteroidaceae bacterium]